MIRRISLTILAAILFCVASACASFCATAPADADRIAIIAREASAACALETTADGRAQCERIATIGTAAARDVGEVSSAACGKGAAK